MKVELQIEGLSCGHCVKAVETILDDLNGVETVEVALPSSAIIEFNTSLVTIEEIKKSINDSEIYKAL